MSINQNQYRPCVGHRDLADNNRDWVKVVLVKVIRLRRVCLVKSESEKVKVKSESEKVKK